MAKRLHRFHRSRPPSVYPAIARATFHPRFGDLRHSVASRALALGEELPMIGKLLGHRRIESTVRYAHLARTAVREAAERVANSLAEDIL